MTTTIYTKEEALKLIREKINDTLWDAEIEDLLDFLYDKEIYYDPKGDVEAQ